ncbi:MAG: ABC transporter permease [Cyclobacteriaceae bacterium]|nr:ABC transporter permease [Cyclobacteriaceae bacterium]MDH4296706.1 ABC transporter permease [Cyclobacteriaceae bacterium]MDH5250227.1 ABC transporter permease [Cyclobacteriaceae bacterium]
MNLLENIKEGLRSIQANLLRSILTALIVAIGITSLVGILTAIDGIESSVNESLSSLGVNTFDIRSTSNRGSNRQGIAEKTFSQLKMNEAFRFIDQYKVTSTISLSARITQIAEVKYLSNKTNPNVFVLGVNDEYMTIKGLEIEKGRNFSSLEIQYGSQVAVIGYKIYSTLYKNNEDPIGTEITFSGIQFRVIGVLKEKGQLADSNYDNMVFVPIIKGNQMSKGQGLRYEITVGISDPSQMEYAMGEATGLMRSIRRDRVGQPNSFELEKSETLAQQLESITSGLRMGGFGIGFITLLGASIALMNIMLVSVTERTREIGVRKALGATALRIRQQFVIEAIVVCLLGGIAGVILGILIGNLLSRAMGITVFVFPWTWMFVGMGVCIFVGLVSGYYPAHKASKLDPIESLRFE